MCSAFQGSELPPRRFSRVPRECWPVRHSCCRLLCCSHLLCCHHSLCCCRLLCCHHSLCCFCFAASLNSKLLKQFSMLPYSSLWCVVGCFTCRFMCCLLISVLHPAAASTTATHPTGGRQGSFPHGIEIVTTADFFSLGNRVAAFTSIAATVACFEEYKQPILEHLLEVKVAHRCCCLLCCLLCCLFVLLPSMLLLPLCHRCLAATFPAETDDNPNPNELMLDADEMNNTFKSSRIASLVLPLSLTLIAPAGLSLG